MQSPDIDQTELTKKAPSAVAGGALYYIDSLKRAILQADLVFGINIAVAGCFECVHQRIEF